MGAGTAAVTSDQPQPGAGAAIPRAAAPVVPAARTSTEDSSPVEIRYVPIWFGCYVGLRLPKGAYLDHLALICSGPRHDQCLKGWGKRGFWTAAVLWDVCHSAWLLWGWWLLLMYVYLVAFTVLSVLVGWL